MKRKLLCATLTGAIVMLPLAMVGCDQTQSEQKSTTTTTTKTPEGTKKTTETTEHKVEQNPK
jgi:hypothetical protein